VRRLHAIAALAICAALHAHDASAGAAHRAAWLQESRWGVMVHFLPDWIEPDREWTSEEWNSLVDGIDVPRLARQLESAGAGYFLISLGQNSGFYLAPNPTYDRLAGRQPSRCSTRDLVADLYDALHPLGIRLLVYLPSGAPNKDAEAVRALEWTNGPHPNRQFAAKWEAVVRDWSLRWGTKISGWWFDGAYWPNQMYRSPDPPNFGSLAAAARSGNPDAIVTFNPGIVYRTISVTPHEDYIAGEIDHPERASIRRVHDGRVDGAQLHMLTYLGETWGRGAPRFTDEEAVEWTRRVLDQRGAMTWDVPVGRDGTIAEPFMERLRAVGEAARQPPAPAATIAPPSGGWGEPPVTVTQSDGMWTISGERHAAVLDRSDLSVTIRAGEATWRMVPSSARDLQVRTGGGDHWLRLADAGEIAIEEYRTGFKTGVKLTLGGFRTPPGDGTSDALDLRLFLTMALEGGDEDLTFEIAAVEGAARIRELNWPMAIDGRDVDATLLSNDDGVLLPRDWPRAYHPIRRARQDTSIIQSHLIESWSMSWWGFQQGPAALLVLVETPDDAAYTFSHPPGGPTSIGPAWRPQLGRFGYLRSLRMAFLPDGDYVDLAKRYRRHVMDTGHFVSLEEKAARQPLVRNLIGAPFVSARVFTNIKRDSPRYDTNDPAKNRHVTPFAEHSRRLRALRARGIERVNVSLSGWPTHGYDRQHPDGLPPNEEGGGWAGMRRFFETCRELGFVCWLHDQYRDYYPDAPSFNRDLAVREEDATSPPTHFPGTRFHPHDWKDGDVPMMNYWDGGPQAYLNNRYMLGHVQKNYRLLAAHGIRPQGSYNDVYGYIPPDQDFNPEHPTTRTESMRYRAEVCHWVRRNLGVMGTEDGADWIVPYVDYVTNRANRNPHSGNDETAQGAVQVPLYELVYHDAVVTTYSPSDPRGLLHGNAPSVRSGDEEGLDQVRRMAALHERVGLLEMVHHAFLDAERTQERTTFADGTTVTVDWTAGTVTIAPDVQSTE